MRVRVDPTSYRASGVRTRDARHDPSPEKPVKHRSRKDRRSWCGGKPGREHQPECRAYAAVKGHRYEFAKHWKVLLCTRCGKELAHYFPFHPYSAKEKERKPAWVVDDAA